MHMLKLKKGCTLTIQYNFYRINVKNIELVALNHTIFFCYLCLEKINYKTKILIKCTWIIPILLCSTPKIFLFEKCYTVTNSYLLICNE